MIGQDNRTVWQDNGGYFCVLESTKTMETEILQIETYSGKYSDEIISLILDIQNNESKINLSLQEQPDLLDISRSYQQNGCEFWMHYLTEK